MGGCDPPEERAGLDKDIKAERAKKAFGQPNLRLVVSIAKRYVGRGMLFLFDPGRQPFGPDQGGKV